MTKSTSNPSTSPRMYTEEEMLGVLHVLYNMRRRNDRAWRQMDKELSKASERINERMDRLDSLAARVLSEVTAATT